MAAKQKKRSKKEDRIVESDPFQEKYDDYVNLVLERMRERLYLFKRLFSMDDYNDIKYKIVFDDFVVKNQIDEVDEIFEGKNEVEIFLKIYDYMMTNRVWKRDENGIRKGEPVNFIKLIYGINRFKDDLNDDNLDVDDLIEDLIKLDNCINLNIEFLEIQ